MHWQPSLQSQLQRNTKTDNQILLLGLPIISGSLATTPLEPINLDSLKKKECFNPSQEIILVNLNPGPPRPVRLSSLRCTSLLKDTF